MNDTGHQFEKLCVTTTIYSNQKILIYIQNLPYTSRRVLSQGP